MKVFEYVAIARRKENIQLLYHFLVFFIHFPPTLQVSWPQKIPSGFKGIKECVLTIKAQ